MEDRMLTSKTQKHYEHIFLHYYFSSISDYCAESMVRSLISKVDSIDGKYKIAVAQMCVWVWSKIRLQIIASRVGIILKYSRKGDRIRKVYHHR